MDPADNPRLPQVLAALERTRRRMWALCYRLTGNRADADDLCQEAAARAIERSGQLIGSDATGWLLRLTARLCLDHLRRQTTARRLNALADPLRTAPLSADDNDAETTLIGREELRYAVVVALQELTPRHRTAIVLHEVCGRPIREVAEVLNVSPNAAKAVLHRARVSLAKARHHLDVDMPADVEVVERFARAVERGDTAAIEGLLADDVWGVVDSGRHGGGSSRPTFGHRVIARQWANAKRRLLTAVTASVEVLNGEATVLVRAAAGDPLIAIVHVETHEGGVCALRVNRDPVMLARLGPISNVFSQA